MTPSTPDRQTQKRSPDRVNLLINHFHPQQFFILLFVVGRPQRQIADARHLIVVLTVTLVRQQIARDVFPDQLVKGLVVVERLDHVVTKTPCVRKHQAPPASAGFGKAGDIQPVTSPAFTKAMRRQQFVDDRINRLIRIH